MSRRLRGSRSTRLLTLLSGLLLPISLSAQSTEVPTAIVSAADPSSTNSPNTQSTIPDCTRSCLTSATLAQPCEATDTECLCAHSRSIHDHTLTCLASSTCSKADITLTANYYNPLCVSLGYPLTASPGNKFGTATDTADPPTIAVGGGSSASPTDTTSQNASGNKSTSKISIIAGVAIGVALLLILALITIFCVLNYRRRQKNRQEREKGLINRSSTADPSATGKPHQTTPSPFLPTSAHFILASTNAASTRMPLRTSRSTVATSLLPNYSPRMSKQLYRPSSSNPALISTSVKRSNTTKSANTIRTNNTDVTYTMVSKSDLSPMTAFPPQSFESALSPSSTHDPQQRNRLTVREIEIRRPSQSPLPPAARRAVSTLGQLVHEDDDDDDDDYTSVSSADEGDVPPKHLERDPSLPPSRNRSHHDSPKHSPSPSARSPAVQSAQPTNPRLSPGLAPFDFGLPHAPPSTSPDRHQPMPSDVSPWGQGAVQGSRHFV